MSLSRTAAVAVISIFSFAFLQLPLRADSNRLIGVFSNRQGAALSAVEVEIRESDGMSGEVRVFMGGTADPRYAKIDKIAFSPQTHRFALLTKTAVSRPDKTRRRPSGIQYPAKFILCGKLEENRITGKFLSEAEKPYDQWSILDVTLLSDRASKLPGVEQGSFAEVPCERIEKIRKLPALQRVEEKREDLTASVGVSQPSLWRDTTSRGAFAPVEVEVMVTITNETNKRHEYVLHRFEVTSKTNKHRMRPQYGDARTSHWDGWIEAHATRSVKVHGEFFFQEEEADLYLDVGVQVEGLQMSQSRGPLVVYQGRPGTNMLKVRDIEGQ